MPIFAITITNPTRGYTFHSDAAAGGKIRINPVIHEWKKLKMYFYSKSTYWKSKASKV